MAKKKPAQATALPTMEYVSPKVLPDYRAMITPEMAKFMTQSMQAGTGAAMLAYLFAEAYPTLARQANDIVLWWYDNVWKKRK